MKKLLILFVILGLSHLSKAQIRFDLWGGLHSYNLTVEDFSEFKAGITESSYGIHLGVKFRLDLGAVYLEPGALFNNVSAKYTVDNPDTPEFETSNLNFDFPAVIGLDFDLIQIFAGPVAHVRFSDYDELKDTGGYSDKASSAFFGSHIGVGLTLGQLGFDVRYEKNFKDNEFGSEELFDSIRLVDTNSRVMFSLVYTLKFKD